MLAYSYATQEEALQIIDLINMEVKYKLYFEPHGYHLLTPSISNNSKYLAGYNSKTLYLYDFSKDVGFDDNLEEAETIYPNPSNGILFIDFFIPKYQLIQINLYDLEGGKLTNLLTKQYQQGQTHEELNVSVFPAGVYFLRIESLGFNKTFRLIIGG